MCEAWEDILMQMALRLTKFVQNTSTQVQDEFLELLLWGRSSPELQALLMNQLTVKLKKLGQSIETSYSSIQKLVISHLQSGSEALKDNKFLQVIDKSMKNFKAFFRWLCVAMLRMSEDHVPPELNKNERAV
uniref:Anaphase-promoting complex subunit 4 n=1 Tax=Hucho hucho TaxID=62062 RepID=A0A4W5KJD0_9TELE